MSEPSIACSCGAIRGRLVGVTKNCGNRVVCYCDDCQLYARHLGCADDLLDAHGGTDVFQMSPRHLQLTRGAEHVACLRLTPTGVLRWYAGCCRTPIAATLATSRIPFLSLVLGCVDAGDDGEMLDRVFGPVRARIFARFAKGGPPDPRAHDGVPPSLYWRAGVLMAKARLRADHRKSAFFDARTGEPIAVPRLIG